MHCQLPCIAKHVLYSSLRTLKYRTLAHVSFTNTIQTLRILKPLCQPAPGTAAATRPCSQITLRRLVIVVVVVVIVPAGLAYFSTGSTGLTTAGTNGVRTRKTDKYHWRSVPLNDHIVRVVCCVTKIRCGQSLSFAFFLGSESFAVFRCIVVPLNILWMS